MTRSSSTRLEPSLSATGCSRPENAVIKLGAGKRFRFNYDYCKGCGICATEWPSGAIRMGPRRSEPARQRAARRIARMPHVTTVPAPTQVHMPGMSP